MSVEQLLALHDRERRVRRRVCTDNLVLQADAYWNTAYAWLQEAKGSRLSQRDHALAEALRVAEDDAHFGSGSAVPPRLEASGPNVASLEARISAMQERIDALTRGMRRLHKQVLAQPRRKR
jgi:hypothetical protein